MRSGFEKRIKTKLKSDKIPFEYETVKLGYTLEKTYIPDFIFDKKDGQTKLYIEAKGRLTASDRSKMIAVKEADPSLDIRFLFQRDNKLTKAKNSKTYTEWATYYGFPSYVGEELPKEWKKEIKGY